MQQVARSSDITAIFTVLIEIIEYMKTRDALQLVALGHDITCSASRTANFAQGGSMMLGAVACYYFSVTPGWSMPAAIAAPLVACGIWGAVVERSADHRVVRFSPLPGLLRFRSSFLHWPSCPTAFSGAPGCFLNTLKRQLPPPLVHLQRNAIAPIDISLASIGSGMAIFSRHGKVMEPDGSAMQVGAALP